ncbi:MAG: hypothetical protein ACLT8E_04535 [Akkermansia sp.]
MDRRTFLLEAAALLALTSCSEPSGKAGMAPMISFKPSGVPVVKRSPRQCWRNATSGRCSCPALPLSAAFLPDEAALHHHAQHGKPFRRRHARARAE